MFGKREKRLALALQSLGHAETLAWHTPLMRDLLAPRAELSVEILDVPEGAGGEERCT